MIAAPWRRAVDRIIGHGTRRIVVIGATDRGKTTFCRYLADRLRTADAVPFLLDGDPGQGLLAPPACVGLQAPHRPEPRFAFVGTPNAAARPALLVAAVARLAAHAGEAPLVVDTCGFVEGPGRRLQAATLAAVAPEAVVVIARHEDSIADLADVLPRRNVLLVPPAPEACRRSATQRRLAREAALRVHFRSARRKRLSLDGVRLRTIDLEPVRAPLETGRLCAVAGPAERQALAVVMTHDPEGSTLTLRTPLSARSIRTVTAGLVTVTRPSEAG